MAKTILNFHFDYLIPSLMYTQFLDGLQITEFARRCVSTGQKGRRVVGVDGRWVVVVVVMLGEQW